MPDLGELDKRAIGQTIHDILCVCFRQHTPAGLIPRQQQRRAFDARPDLGKFESVSPVSVGERAIAGETQR